MLHMWCRWYFIAVCVAGVFDVLFVVFFVVVVASFCSLRKSRTRFLLQTTVPLRPLITRKKNLWLSCVVWYWHSLIFFVFCTIDRAAVCKNPNDYQGDRNVTGGYGSCDAIAASSTKLTSAKDCSTTPYDASSSNSNPKEQSNMLSMHYGCCGTGLGACALDYSYGVFVFVCLWEPLLIAWYPFWPPLSFSFPFMFSELPCAKTQTTTKKTKTSRWVPGTQ